MLEAYYKTLESVDSFMPRYGEQFLLVAHWNTALVFSIDSPRSKKVNIESAMQAFAHPVIEEFQEITRFQELHEN